MIEGATKDRQSIGQIKVVLHDALEARSPFLDRALME
jgi:hypothetical protein